MSYYYFPFNRYYWDFRNEPNIQTVINPFGYDTTKEEVEWYVNEIIIAQWNYHAFVEKNEQSVAFIPIALWIACIIIIGTLMGWEVITMSAKKYGISLLFGSWFWSIWAIIVSSFHSLKVFFKFSSVRSFPAYHAKCGTHFVILFYGKWV